MGDGPVQAMTDWVNSQSDAAWDRLVSQYGTQPQAYKNAFFHAYSAALLTRFFGNTVSIGAGFGRELNTWGRDRGTIGGRRDVFKDMYNNDVGTQITAELVRQGVNLRNTNALEQVVFDALLDGHLIVFTSTDPRVPASLSDDIRRVFSMASDAAQGTYGAGQLPPLNQIPGVQVDDSWHVPASYSPSMDDLDPITVTDEMREQAAREFARRIAEQATIEVARQQGGVLGSLIGSTLGGLIGGENAFSVFVSRTVFSAVGARIGQAIGVASATSANDILPELGLAFQDVANLRLDLGTAFAGAAIGTVSSFMALELGDALGLDGDVGRVFGSVAGSMIEVGINNAIAGKNLLDGISAVGDLFDGPFFESGAANILGSSIASFLAVKLGSLIVQPQTQAAVVLSSLGTAAGGWAFGTAAGGLGWGTGIGNFVASKLGGGAVANWLGLNVIAPGIGMLIGFVLGALFGNLFGRKKPRIPTANAEVVLQIPNAEYALGAVSQANGGNIDLVRAMGEAARDTLNGLIAVVSYGDENARVSNTFSPTQVYGHTASQLWVKLGGATAPAANVNSADEAVDKGVLYALPATQIVGGDMLAKRAVNDNATNVSDIAAMLVAAA